MDSFCISNDQKVSFIINKAFLLAIPPYFVYNDFGDTMDYAKRLTQVFQTEDIKIEHVKDKGISINKYIADSGYCSRRKADELIQSGVVTLNGMTAQLGMRVEKNDIVKIDGAVVKPIEDKVYIVLNKPEGIVCTTERHIENNIVDYMHLDEVIFPIGRLDKDSRGLILLTNDGDIVNKILRVEYGHEKEYLVEVDKPLTKSFIDYMEQGVVIFNLKTKKFQQTEPCKLIQEDDTHFRIILKQGMNRQIRRMTTALGYEVVSLERIRIMHITKTGLPVGYYRYLTNDELIKLNQSIQK